MPPTIASTNAPRPIVGGPGKRIRVILGKNGKDWLLLLNHDDGNRKWQETNWRCGPSLPAGLGRQMNNCDAKGRDVSVVDFGLNDAWYVHGIRPDGTGGHSWWGGLNGALSARVKSLAGLGGNLKVSFGVRNGRTSMCLISGRNGYSVENIDQNLFQRLQRVNNENGMEGLGYALFQRTQGFQ